jgi:hypothetical protein
MECWCSQSPKLTIGQQTVRSNISWLWLFVTRRDQFRIWRSPFWPGRRSECARFNSQREHQTQVPGHKATLIRSNKSEIGKKNTSTSAKKHTCATRALSTRQSQRLMIFRVEAVHNRCFEEWEKSQQRSGELAPFRGASGGEFILGRTLFHAWLDDVHANVLTTMQWVEDYNNALARF